jgi:SAM-dependent methyltransferase
VKNVQESYEAFHERKAPANVYPTEWVIRTMLGTYPGLELDHAGYPGAKILDVGFGDGRNWPLLRDIGFEIHGLEITQPILELGARRAEQLGVPVTLLLGSNASIPAADATYDYILACHSCYYVDAGTTFSDNVAELARVLKPGGTLIASLPEAGASIFDGCVALDDGHVEIRDDPWGLRHGFVFRRFETEAEIAPAFMPHFERFSVGLCRDDYFGLRVNVFLVVCHKPVAGRR